MKNWLWFPLVLALAGCNQPNGNEHGNSSESSPSKSNPEMAKRNEIKPAVKVGTDASKIGTDTYQFISVVDSLPQAATADRTQFEQLIFQPSRQLLIRWGTEVSQKDSAVGDEYTICKGALMSLNSWARAVLEQPSLAASKQQVYEGQKKLCEQVVLKH